MLEGRGGEGRSREIFILTTYMLDGRGGEGRSRETFILTTHTYWQRHHLSLADKFVLPPRKTNNIFFLFCLTSFIISFFFSLFVYHFFFFSLFSFIISFFSFCLLFLSFSFSISFFFHYCTDLHFESIYRSTPLLRIQE